MIKLRLGEEDKAVSQVLPKNEGGPKNLVKD